MCLKEYCRVDGVLTLKMYLKDGGRDKIQQYRGIEEYW